MGAVKDVRGTVNCREEFGILKRNAREKKSAGSKSHGEVLAA